MRVIGKVTFNHARVLLADLEATAGLNEDFNLLLTLISEHAPDINFVHFSADVDHPVEKELGYGETFFSKGLSAYILGERDPEIPVIVLTSSNFEDPTIQEVLTAWNCLRLVSGYFADMSERRPIMRYQMPWEYEETDRMIGQAVEVDLKYTPFLPLPNLTYNTLEFGSSKDFTLFRVDGLLIEYSVKVGLFNKLPVASIQVRARPNFQRQAESLVRALMASNAKLNIKLTYQSEYDGPGEEILAWESWDWNQAKPFYLLQGRLAHP